MAAFFALTALPGCTSASTFLSASSPPVSELQWRSLKKKTVKANHGLYGSTSCCISHGPSQWERAIFDPHSSETPGPIFMELGIYNYFPDTIPHAKFQGPTSTWVVWANSQFDAWKFLSSFLSHAHRSHFWTHPNAQYVIMRRSRCLFGVRKFQTAFNGDMTYISRLKQQKSKRFYVAIMSTCS